MADLRGRGADGASRLHQSRRFGFGTGRRLGHDDHVVTWTRPARPAWVDRRTHLAAPKRTEVREARFRVRRPGYRSREVVVATTPLDASASGKADLADLYGHRWRVELDIHDIKQTMKMDVPRGKTPEHLRREIRGHLLAYNPTRQVMARAALSAGLSPRWVSFAGAKRTWTPSGRR